MRTTDEGRRGNDTDLEAALSEALTEGLEEAETEGSVSATSSNLQIAAIDERRSFAKLPWPSFDALKRARGDEAFVDDYDASRKLCHIVRSPDEASLEIRASDDLIFSLHENLTLINSLLNELRHRQMELEAQLPADQLHWLQDNQSTLRQSVSPPPSLEEREMKELCRCYQQYRWALAGDNDHTLPHPPLATDVRDKYKRVLAAACDDTFKLYQRSEEAQRPNLSKKERGEQKRQRTIEALRRRENQRGLRNENQNENEIETEIESESESESDFDEVPEDLAYHRRKVIEAAELNRAHDKLCSDPLVQEIASKIRSLPMPPYMPSYPVPYSPCPNAIQPLALAPEAEERAPAGRGGDSTVQAARMWKERTRRVIEQVDASLEGLQTR